MEGHAPLVAFFGPESQFLAAFVCTWRQVGIVCQIKSELIHLHLPIFPFTPTPSCPFVLRPSSPVRPDPQPVEDRKANGAQDRPYRNISNTAYREMPCHFASYLNSEQNGFPCDLIYDESGSYWQSEKKLATAKP